jgi:hypothetical protein
MSRKRSLGSKMGFQKKIQKAMFLKSLWFKFWIKFQNNFWFKNLKIQKIDFQEDLNFILSFQNLFQIILKIPLFKAFG